MIYEKDNRNNFLFSAIIIGICFWAFSSVSTDSFSGSQNSSSTQTHVYNEASELPDEFISAENNYSSNYSVSTRLLESGTQNINYLHSILFSAISEIKIKSCKQIFLDIKPLIQKILTRHIITSNFSLEYQSIS